VVEGPGRSEIAARLFDTDRTDRELTLEEALEVDVGDEQLLWIDLPGLDRPDELGRLLERLELTPRTRRDLDQPAVSPLVAIGGAYVHVRVATLEPDGDVSEPPWLDIVAGPNLVLTLHRGPIEFLAGLDEQVEADASLGRIDAAQFGAMLLDGVVTTYYKAVDGIEDAVDQLDSRSLQRGTTGDLLPDLVEVRRRIATLRQVLSDQREVFAALGRRDLEAGSDVGDFAAFPGVAQRYERAIDAVENSRDLLLGSFEVYMTRTAQRTNDTMKVLALASVLLLPGSLVAGLLGMNMPGPFASDDTRAFWIVVAMIAALAGLTLLVARLRRWI
jgi:Mg2+ and Co2+ transporter CorA